MHYYQFNIADYRKDTQHLSPIEHYIYRELMDWYYLDEKPIPKKTQLVIRRLRLVSENNQDLENVLQEFFTETDSGWEHGRIEGEIGRYHAKADTARANGSKGGRPKKPKKTHPDILANPEITRSKANQEPLTINQLKEKEQKEIADRVITDLNAKAGKGYKLIDTNRKPIIARLNNGFTESDCLKVIANRCQKWLGTEQDEYLRPETLFRASKFEGYLNDKGAPNGKPNNPGGGNAAPKQTAAQRIAARRQQLAAQSPDMGVVATHDGDVWPPVDESAGRGTQRYLASGNS